MVSMTLRLLALSGILMCSMATVLPGQALGQSVLMRLDSMMRASDRTDGPGFALGIIQNGVPLYSKATGMANLETRTVFRPVTVSDIGSVAKQFTCMAVILLAQQGKLDPDEDIRKYLDGIPDFGQKITVRHLMNHTSGLREIYDMLALRGWQQGDGIRQEDAADLVGHSLGLNFVPNTEYAYCNTGYMLLGNLVAKLGGKPFETWMREHIFLPLGMENTYIMDQQGELFPDCAESYAKSKGEWVKLYDNSTAYGQGGIYSTTPDMLKWLDNFRTGRVGGSTALEALSRRGVLNNGDTLTYALGIEHGNYRGIPLLKHTGSSAGYRAIMCYIPGSEIGIMLKSNYSGFNAEGMAEKVLDILFDLSREEAVPATSLADLTFESISAPLTDYIGRYFSPELEVFYEVFEEKGTLFAKGRKTPIVELGAIKPDFFQGKTFLGEIMFGRDKKRRIVGMHISSGGAKKIWMEKKE